MGTATDRPLGSIRMSCHIWINNASGTSNAHNNLWLTYVGICIGTLDCSTKSSRVVLVADLPEECSAGILINWIRITSICVSWPTRKSIPNAQGSDTNTDIYIMDNCWYREGLYTGGDNNQLYYYLLMDQFRSCLFVGKSKIELICTYYDALSSKS